MIPHTLRQTVTTTPLTPWLAGRHMCGMLGPASPASDWLGGTCGMLGPASEPSHWSSWRPASPPSLHSLPHFSKSGGRAASSNYQISLSLKGLPCKPTHTRASAQACMQKSVHGDHCDRKKPCFVIFVKCFVVLNFKPGLRRKCSIGQQGH